MEELSDKQIAHAIINLPAAIKGFREREEAEDDHRRDQSGGEFLGEPETTEDEPPF